MDKDNNASRELFEAGYLTEKQYQDISEYRQLNIFSLNTELRMLLYAGILAITTGLGILVYKNIETIGHTVIITAIGLASAACFIWCFKNAQGFSKGATVNANALFDYLLLAACLLAGIFTAYLQYQYNVFGDHYGLATLAPTVLYLFCAYFFDNRGILALGITGLGAWLGITVAPTDLLHNSFTYNVVFDYTAMSLGTGLIIYTHYAEQIKLKQHFNFTYRNFALHLIFIGALSGLFMQTHWALFLIPIALASAYFLWLALTTHSFYFLLFTVVYVYIAISDVVLRNILSGNFNTPDIELAMLYLIVSCFGMIYSLIKLRKYIKQ